MTENYRPVIPPDECILGAPTSHVTPNKDGLYNRSGAAFDPESLKQLLLDHPEDTSLTSYQYWAESNWKEEHGTTNALARFREKINEEFREVVTAIDFDSSSREAQDGIASELGDMLWCLTALASNSGANLDKGLKQHLFNYLNGTNIIVDGEPTQPEWYSFTAELSTKFNAIDLSEIDQLIRLGYEPQPSLSINIYNPDGSEFDTGEHLQLLLMKSLALILNCEQQFGLAGPSDRTYSLYSYYLDHALKISEQAASCLLEIAYLGNSLGFSLSSIASQNVKKVEARVANKQIDKTDNPR